MEEKRNHPDRGRRRMNRIASKRKWINTQGNLNGIKCKFFVFKNNDGKKCCRYSGVTVPVSIMWFRHPGVGSE